MSQELMAVAKGKRSAAEWRSLVKAYQKRTCTQVEFCAAHGIAASTLDWWRRKLERGAQRQLPLRREHPSRALDFIDISPAVIATPPWDIELDLGAGVVLRMRRG